MSDMFVSTAAPLSPAGFDSACEALGGDAASLWSLPTVETRGFGFPPDRRPKILFERHIFHARGRTVLQACADLGVQPTTARTQLRAKLLVIARLGDGIGSRGSTAAIARVLPEGTSQAQGARCGARLNRRTTRVAVSLNKNRQSRGSHAQALARLDWEGACASLWRRQASLPDVLRADGAGLGGGFASATIEAAASLRRRHAAAAHGDVSVAAGLQLRDSKIGRVAGVRGQQPTGRVEVLRRATIVWCESTSRYCSLMRLRCSCITTAKSPLTRVTGTDR